MTAMLEEVNRLKDAVNCKYLSKPYVLEEDFPGHEGIPGHQGGSLPRDAAGGNGLWGSDPPKTFTNEKNRSSGNQWKSDILQADHEGGGHISLNYAKADSYERINNNTTRSKTTLSHGVVISSRGVESHNINWDKVTRVSGNTFVIKNLLKDKGFKFEPPSKEWVKP